MKITINNKIAPAATGDIPNNASASVSLTLFTIIYYYM